MKKISQKFVDQLLKYLSLGLLYVAAIVVVAFSLSSSLSKVDSHFGHAYTANIYLSPYVLNKDQSSSDQTQIAFDQAQQRSDETSKSLSAKERAAKLNEIVDCYAQRLVFLGYQEPRATWETRDISKNVSAVAGSTNGEMSDYLNSSWLDNGMAMHIRLSVDRPINLEMQEDSKQKGLAKQFVQEFIDNQMNLSNQLSLETTDGVVAFTNQDINQKSIRAESSSSQLLSSNDVSFTLRNESCVLKQLLALLDNQNIDVSSKGVLANSSFSSPNWRGVQDAGYLNDLIGASRADVPNGDRILVLWNSKYTAVNYARRVYYLYKLYEKDQPSLDACLNNLEQKFGNFLVHGNDQTNSLKIASKNWDGFKSPQEIKANLLGYFCFKSNTAVDAKEVSLTDYAPLFSHYILSYFRAQTGKKADGTGIEWTNTSEFTSFLVKRKPTARSGTSPVLPKIKIEKVYLTPAKVDLDNPKADLVTLDTANARRVAGALQTALPNGLVVLRTDYVPYQTEAHLQKTVVAMNQMTNNLDRTNHVNVVASLPAWLILLGLGIAFLLAGVFMVSFYRVAGFMSWFGMVLGLAITYTLFFKFAGILTLASVFGLLFVGLLNLFSWIHTFELFRRRLRELTPVSLAFKKATKQAFMPVVDMHLMVAFFAIPLLFVGKYVAQSFSVITIVGLFFSLFVSYVFGLLTVNIFLNNHFWKSTRYLIWGKYKLSSLNDTQPASEEKTLEQFSHTQRHNWWAKRYRLTAYAGFSLLVITIIGIILGQCYPLFGNFAIKIVVNNVFVAWGIGFVISLVYLWWRYRWPGTVTFFITSLCTLLMLYGGAQMFLLPNKHFEFNDLILLLVIYLISSIWSVSSTDLQHSYFYGSKSMDLVELADRANWSLGEGFQSKWLLALVSLVVFNLFLIVNVPIKYSYQDELANEILMFDGLMIMISTFNLCLNPFIYLGLVKLHNRRLQRSSKGASASKKHRWERVNYDTCDEQTIVGINARE